jgi:hypothetical protein
MLFLQKEFVYELMLDKYPHFKFEPPVPCSFNLCTRDFNNSISELIQSVLGTAGNTGIVGDITFSFLKEPSSDRAYSLDLSVTDFRNASFSLIAEEMEAVSEVVAKELIFKRCTIKHHYGFLEVTDLAQNWDTSIFQMVSVNFVGWKITKGNA